MNNIDAKYTKTPYRYLEYYWKIDGKSVVEHLEENINVKEKKKNKFVGSFLGLMPAWTGELEERADNKFIWNLIDSDEELNVPILVCEEDCDLSCITVVAHIRKTEKFIYWDKLGLVKHDNWDEEKEHESGILCLEKYTDEDWEKYGDNIATEKYGNPEYWDWYHENREEEILRQHVNYMKPYMQSEENITWLLTVNWVFSKNQYNEMVEKYRDLYRENMHKNVSC